MQRLHSTKLMLHLPLNRIAWYYIGEDMKAFVEKGYHSNFEFLSLGRGR
jgi:hypothetical protein